jgi:hypothetical protein
MGEPAAVPTPGQAFRATPIGDLTDLKEWVQLLAELDAAQAANAALREQLLEAKADLAEALWGRHDR